MQPAMVIYILVVASCYALFLYALIRAIKRGLDFRRFLAPLIFLTGSAAIGVPAIIRMLAFALYTKWNAGLFFLSAGLAYFAILAYVPGTVSFLRHQQKRQTSPLQKALQVFILLGGIFILAAILWVAALILLYL